MLWMILTIGEPSGRKSSCIIKQNASGWLFFQSEFEVAKGMVADWTEQEELDLLVKKLPMGWRTRVLRQEAKESKHKFAVKVLNSPVGGERLRMVLGGLGVQVVDVRY